MKNHIIVLERKCWSNEQYSRRECLETSGIASDMDISSPIFINDSLCVYYKKLWAKCKKLWLNKYIHGFWVSYGLIKIMVSERSLPVTITHDVDLENKFAGSPLLKDNSEDWDDSNKLYVTNIVFFVRLPLLK